METVLDRFYKGARLVLKVISSGIQVYQDSGELAKFITDVANDLVGTSDDGSDDEL